MAYWKPRGVEEHFELVLVDPDDPDWRMKLLDYYFKAQPMQAIWQPVPVELEPLPRERNRIQPTEMGNFPTVSGIQAWDRRAVETLRPLIEGQVEFLPLTSTVGDFFLINVINVLGCLDHDRAEFYYSSVDVDQRIVGVKRYIFKEGCLDGQHIFCLAENNYSRIYVSDTFKETVEANGLVGMRFKKAWD
ncbi:hypothetical protein FBQ95_18085 [Chloroflexi bacterium CFX3]|nr:hypothetical protein [Chloroflexi bacterium CFX3]